MKKTLLTKLMATTLAVTSIISLNSIEAYAEWKKDNHGWWYSESNSWATGWRYIGEYWYYFDESGYMQNGWILNNNTWYYLDSNGAMKTGWILDRGIWYYCNASGEMQTGTIKVDGKVYLLNRNGAMQTGLIEINGQLYTFADSGEAIGENIPTCINEFDKYGNKKSDDINGVSSSIEDITVETNKDEIKTNKGSSSSGGSSSGVSSNNKNKTFKVKFHPYEGAQHSIKTITVNKNSTIKELPDYEKRDEEDARAYELKGWYINDELQLTTETPITSDMDVYPKWYAINGDNKNNVIDKIYLELQQPAIGNTPKNAIVDSDAPYKVIATRWFGGYNYATVEMEADDIFKKEDKYKVKVLLMAKEGYQFYTEPLWFMGADGRKVYVNGEGRDIDNGSMLSGAKFYEIEFHYNDLYNKPDIIDNNVELESNFDFEIWKDEGFSDYYRCYINIYYDKETLDIKMWGTGSINNTEGLGLLILEYNLENFYAFNHMEEYELICDNGQIELVRKYEQPITVLYDKKTLEIKKMRKGINTVLNMIDNEEENINSRNYDVLVISAVEYADDKYEILNNQDDYELVKDGEMIKFQLKEYNDIFEDLLKSSITTSSSVSIK